MAGALTKGLTKETPYCIGRNVGFPSTAVSREGCSGTAFAGQTSQSIFSIDCFETNGKSFPTNSHTWNRTHTDCSLQKHQEPQHVESGSGFTVKNQGQLRHRLKRMLQEASFFASKGDRMLSIVILSYDIKALSVGIDKWVLRQVRVLE